MEAMMKAMMSKKKEYSKEEMNFALAVVEVQKCTLRMWAIIRVPLESPERE